RAVGRRAGRGAADLHDPLRDLSRAARRRRRARLGGSHAAAAQLPGSGVAEVRHRRAHRADRAVRRCGRRAQRGDAGQPGPDEQARGRRGAARLHPRAGAVSRTASRERGRERTMSMGIRTVLGACALTGLLACGGSEEALRPSGGPGARAGVAELMAARGLTDADVAAALKTYVPSGKKDEYYVFSSGGQSGQVLVLGVPSMRILKYIAVFTPEPWQGWGYGDQGSEEVLA